MILLKTAKILRYVFLHVIYSKVFWDAIIK